MSRLAGCSGFGKTRSVNYCLINLGTSYMTTILGLLLLVAAAGVWFLMRDRDTAASLAGGLVITAGIVLALPFFTRGVMFGSMAVHEVAAPTPAEPPATTSQP